MQNPRCKAVKYWMFYSYVMKLCYKTMLCKTFSENFRLVSICDAFPVHGLYLQSGNLYVSVKQ